MTGRIPQAFIDELLDRADIVEVINSRVPLKKAGRDFVARCPFHDEKTPSFTVSPYKQFYYCFGCGASGSAIGFLMEHEHLSFPEAIEVLAAQYGLTVPREAGGEARSRDDDARNRITALLRLNQEVAVFYASQLREDVGREAVAYLRARGVDGKTAGRFGLGYAPAGWDSLGSRFPSDQLLKAGLTIERESGGSYDRFRHRIIFPIRNRRGQVIGFGGRALGDAQPKYLNSPETPAFHKGREVYGLYELLQSVGKPSQLLVVEGYMDVIALAQQGIHFAVATLGTAVTGEHLQLLFRYSDSLVFCFDGDAAGRKAAWRALEAALPHLREGRKLGFLWLPEGEDPDSLVRREGPQSFTGRFQGAEPMSEYFFRHLTGGLNLERMEDRADLYRRAKTLLGRLPKGPFREMMWARLKELAGNVHVESRQGGAERKWQRVALRQPNLEDRLAALLLHYPELCEALPASFRDGVSRGHCGEFLAMVLSVLEDEQIQSPEEGFRNGPYHEKVQACLRLSEFRSLEDPRHELLDAATALQKKTRQKRLEALARKADSGGLNDEEKEELKRLMQTRAI